MKGSSQQIVKWRYAVTYNGDFAQYKRQQPGHCGHANEKIKIISFTLKIYERVKEKNGESFWDEYGNKGLQTIL